MHWPVLERLGLSAGASPTRLRFSTSLEAALEGAQFVQENGPERADLKQELLSRRTDAATAEDVLLASSSCIHHVGQRDANGLHAPRTSRARPPVDPPAP